MQFSNTRISITKTRNHLFFQENIYGIRHKVKHRDRKRILSFSLYTLCTSHANAYESKQEEHVTLSTNFSELSITIDRKSDPPRTRNGSVQISQNMLTRCVHTRRLRGPTIAAKVIA